MSSPVPPTPPTPGRPSNVSDAQRAVEMKLAGTPRGTELSLAGESRALESARHAAPRVSDAKTAGAPRAPDAKAAAPLSPEPALPSAPRAPDLAPKAPDLAPRAPDVAPRASDAAHAEAPLRMPAIQGSSRPVELARCVERNTGVALAISGTIAVIVSAALIASITGAVIAGVLMLVGYLAERRARAIVRASSLRVGLSQFPEIHACVTSFARRLGLDDVPEVYVLDSGEVNGFALKLGKRSGILLTDEAVAACLEGRNPGALAFVIGHELGHVALGHHKWWRRNLSKFLWLSRLDECSADNVGFELVGSRDAAEAGVLLLVAGPRLLPYVDRAAARAQARDVGLSRPTRSAERALTHPLAMHRLARVAERMPGTASDRRLAA